MGEADHMQRITDEHLRELEKQHRKVAHVAYNGHDLVFRRPTRAEAAMYREQIDSQSSKAERAAADEHLAQVVVVQVDDVVGDGTPTGQARVRETFNALLEEHPLLCMAAPIGRTLGRLTGILQEETQKK